MLFLITLIRLNAEHWHYQNRMRSGKFGSFSDLLDEALMCSYGNPGELRTPAKDPIYMNA